MTNMFTEESNAESKTLRRRDRPLGRGGLGHQRWVIWRRSGWPDEVGMIVSREADDDPWARWFVTSLPGGIIQRRISWESVSAGELFPAPGWMLDVAEMKAVTKWLRADLNVRLGVQRRSGP
ncbi:hypothetical protein [Streptomyces sp. NPDC048340]|uniref:hypothetical protein n=1 Tax=Streptomyces sp. NPDC048340 TaxID=3365537 RepID=UPI0037219B67